MSNLMTASRQWASRPDDQRYVSLEALKEGVAKRRGESWTTAVPLPSLRIMPVAGDDLVIQVEDRTRNRIAELEPSNWSFAQLCGAASCPTSYLKTLPAELAAINLQYGLEHNAKRDDGLILAHENGEHRLTALTSTTYGRIWDEQVVDAVIKVNGDGRWEIPAASYAAKDPKRATTLYASDRDVFIFLVDPKNPIEVAGEQLFRGFMVWNSEVGSKTFGLTTFLYRYVCDNRIIWGATNVQELTIRHTGGAPERFAYEGRKYLERYAEESGQVLEGQIVAAKNLEVVKEDKGVTSWLQARGFTKAVADAAKAKAEEEEGSARSLWNIVQGITAHARSVNNADDRVDLERRAGNLLNLVSGK